MLTNLVGHLGCERRDCPCPDHIDLSMSLPRHVETMEAELQDKNVAKLMEQLDAILLRIRTATQKLS